MNGIGYLYNNSILEANSHGRISQLLCLSGSNVTNVGCWIGPNGTNLNGVADDPFDVVHGDGSTPGELHISTPNNNPPLDSTHKGVYTCSIPDESGVDQHLHVGIYFNPGELITINNKKLLSYIFNLKLY